MEPVLTIVGKGFVLEGTTIVSRNFSGNPSEYNKAGDKQFSLVLSKENATKLMDAGYPVKTRNKEDQNAKYVTSYFLQVKCGTSFPPIIYLVRDGIVEELPEDKWYKIDRMDIESVDMEVTASAYKTPMSSGIKAYLREMYITPHYSALQQKYTNRDKGNPWGNLTDEEEEL